ncbi:hypothetical protein PI124_g22416 [Phytophthora idaei]|nr:hypothetical protein PI125_g24186 [Phytophthora idaei]KAG3126639.1 hypothetical protein PI126_g22234 [Phytophthora idaei]KAG3232500.1 hypothetical protein PI124_g22416 [Phytophthora idaei]
MEATAPTPSPMALSRKRRRLVGHAHIQFDDWVTVAGVQRRRQRSCMVCALLRGDHKTSFQTTYFCEGCSQTDAKFFLCPKSHHSYEGMRKTCYQIWHEDFDSGSSIPASLGKRVVLRRSGTVGTRKPTRRELLCHQDCDADNEEVQPARQSAIDFLVTEGLRASPGVGLFPSVNESLKTSNLG